MKLCIKYTPKYETEKEMKSTDQQDQPKQVNIKSFQQHKWLEIIEMQK